MFLVWDCTPHTPCLLSAAAPKVDVSALAAKATTYAKGVVAEMRTNAAEVNAQSLKTVRAYGGWRTRLGPVHLGPCFCPRSTSHSCVCCVRVA